MATLLKVEKLEVGYGKNIVIRNASFEIKNGDFVCVVGANGSGKSTLIKAILGLVKPIKGKITFSNRLTKNEIGYLPQEMKVEQNFPATVWEIVLSGNLGKMKTAPFYKTAEKKRSTEALKKLGISHLAQLSFTELSGGQKQKVLLARALVAMTKLLILDEPSNNLDYVSRHDFYETLKSLNRTEKMTIIMITHDLDAEDLIGNKIFALADSKVTVETTKNYLRRYR